MVKHDKLTANLTHNQKLVMSTLEAAKCPLSAYSILDKLRGDGFRAPLQVYRALEKLIELGIVHRIESMNAFIACNHSSCKMSNITAFAICDRCDTVSEVKDADLTDYLTISAKKSGLKLTKSNLEFHGLCTQCETLNSPI